MAGSGITTRAISEQLIAVLTKQAMRTYASMPMRKGEAEKCIESYRLGCTTMLAQLVQMGIVEYVE